MKFDWKKLRNEIYLKAPQAAIFAGILLVQLILVFLLLLFTPINVAIFACLLLIVFDVIALILLIMGE